MQIARARRRRPEDPFRTAIAAMERGIGSGFQLMIQSIDGMHDGKKPR
jgi:hypothetical protein